MHSSHHDHPISGCVCESCTGNLKDSSSGGNGSYGIEEMDSTPPSLLCNNHVLFGGQEACAPHLHQADNNSIDYVLASMGMMMVMPPPLSIQETNQEKEEGDEMVITTKLTYSSRLQLVGVAVGAAALLFILMNVSWWLLRISEEDNEEEEENGGRSAFVPFLKHINITAAAHATDILSVASAHDFGSGNNVVERIVNAIMPIRSSSHKKQKLPPDSQAFFHVIYMQRKDWKKSRKKGGQCTRGNALHPASSSSSLLLLSSSWPSSLSSGGAEEEGTKKSIVKKKLSILAPVVEPATLPRFMERQESSGKEPEGWHLQEFRDALQRACRSIGSSSAAVAAVAQLVDEVNVDDVLVPSRLCRMANETSLTLGGIARQVFFVDLQDKSFSFVLFVF